VLENPAVKAIEVLRQDRDGDGFFAPADCDDLNPAAHPGLPEVCDGADNDCNGLVDDLPPPAGLPAVSVDAAEGGGAAISWSALAGADGYDLIAGDLTILANTGGDFAVAVTDCLVDDEAVSSYQDATPPPVDGGRFYLVRGRSCGVGGSWDEGGAGQVAPRGPGITLSAAACP
jgi:Putative metal-binding motif